jgi:hypothetical protein
MLIVDGPVVVGICLLAGTAMTCLVGIAAWRLFVVATLASAAGMAIALESIARYLTTGNPWVVWGPCLLATLCMGGIVWQSRRPLAE